MTTGRVFAVVEIVHEHNLGRGLVATADMKARIAALRKQGVDVIDALWERNRLAVLGEGYTYDFAREAADEVRPARQRG
jgi:hypothetical protein